MSRRVTNSLILCCLLWLFSTHLHANSLNFTSDDSTRKALNRQINKQARIAMGLSAALPGAGQIYNRKWWKVPIIYAAGGAFTWLALKNQQNYKLYSNALKYRYDGDASTIDPYPTLSDANVIVLKNSYRRNRDLSVAGIALVYLLNIIDANVDAHLRKFDMSDNLSLRVRPKVYYLPATNFGGGICFNISFKP